MARGEALWESSHGLLYHNAHGVPCPGDSGCLASVCLRLHASLSAAAVTGTASPGQKAGWHPPPTHTPRSTCGPQKVSRKWLRIARNQGLQPSSVRARACALRQPQVASKRRPRGLEAHLHGKCVGFNPSRATHVSGLLGLSPFVRQHLQKTLDYISTSVAATFL